MLRNLGLDPTPRLLFHGTNEANIDSILRNNFRKVQSLLMQFLFYLLMAILVVYNVNFCMCFDPHLHGSYSARPMIRICLILMAYPLIFLPFFKCLLQYF
jgi:hypothetical protein